MVIKIRELLNETQDFNYDKEKVLEELVDVLHSAISLSIDCLGIYEECYSKQKEALYCLINETNVLNESDFGSKLLYLVQNDTNKIQILSFISAIFGFGNYLGFSNLEIKDACKRKNKKKLSRIEKNY
jgi:dimeric dUTPase (all-alpha-NTP-PPase superfamily)